MEYKEKFIIGKGKDKHGLHSRPAENLVNLCRKFEKVEKSLKIYLASKRMEVDGCKFIPVLALGGTPGKEIEVKAISLMPEITEDKLKKAVRTVGDYISHPRY